MSTDPHDTPQGRISSLETAAAPTLAPGAGAAAIPPSLPRRFGDHELLEEIARGGMGVVFRARQINLDRVVAVKMILAGQLASTDDVQRFRTEATAAAQLDHPNLVPVYEVGEIDGQHYFSMKLVEGDNLAQRLAGGPASEPRPLVEMLARAARAIQHAHEHGILHRDLKPSNILVDQSGQPHVTDFGLARRVSADRRLTQTGAILGTPSYMAPEQARGDRALSPAVDVYSLGAILYEVLTGRPPFQAATPLDTLLEVLERDPKRPRALNPRVDPDLETICLKCLEKEPARRYGSAAALADELERWLAGEPIQARPAGKLRRLRRWLGRRRVAVTVLALSVLLVVALVGAGFLYRARLNDRYEALLKRADEEGRQGRYDEAEALLDECPWLVRDARLEQSRQQVRESRRRSERRTLLDKLRLALAEGDFARAETLLDQCRPEARDAEWQDLKRSLRPPRQVLELPERWNTGVAFSSDGRLLAVFHGTTSAGIRLFDTTTWKPAADIVIDNIFDPDKKWVTNIDPDVLTVAFSPDSRRLAAVTHQGRTDGRCHVRIWQVSDRQQVVVSRKLTYPLKSSDGVQIVAIHIAFSPDGRLLFGYLRDAGSYPPRNEQVVVWDAGSGKQLRHFFPAPSSAPLWYRPGRFFQNHEAFAFSVDGRRFARGGRRVRESKASRLNSAGSLLPAQFWDTTTGKEQVVPATSRIAAQASLAFSPDLRLLAVEEGGDTVAVRETASGKELCRLMVPFVLGGLKNRLAFSPDGHYLIAQKLVNPPLCPAELIVWDVKKGRMVSHLRAFRGPIMGGAEEGPFAGMAWHPGGRLFAVATDREVRIFDVAALDR
jgi:WD40 repeat protein